MAHRDHTRQHPFLDTDYFGQANEFLQQHHKQMIQWSIELEEN